MVKIELYDSYVQVLERCINSCVTGDQLDCVYDLIERFDILYRNMINGATHLQNMNYLTDRYTSRKIFLN
jgi:hypothetical protein